VRKFVRIALVVCLAVTAVAVVLFASLWLWTWHKTAQVESFYRENHLFNEMRAGQKNSTNDSPPAREALLKIVPLGTDIEAAAAMLRGEGLGCQTIAEPVTDTRLRQRFLEARGSERRSDQKRLRRLSSDDSQRPGIQTLDRRLGIRCRWTPERCRRRDLEHLPVAAQISPTNALTWCRKRLSREQCGLPVLARLRHPGSV
jgi:hypothetical protein